MVAPCLYLKLAATLLDYMPANLNSHALNSRCCQFPIDIDGTVFPARHDEVFPLNVLEYSNLIRV